MPRLGIDRGFLREFGRLNRSVQDRVHAVFAKFESATHTGLHLERVRRLTPEQVWSVPFGKAVTPADQNELTHREDLQRERCPLFVACTRAREQLHLSWHATPARPCRQRAEHRGSAVPSQPAGTADPQPERAGRRSWNPTRWRAAQVQISEAAAPS